MSTDTHNIPLSSVVGPPSDLNADYPSSSSSATASTASPTKYRFNNVTKSSDAQENIVSLFKYFIDDDLIGEALRNEIPNTVDIDDLVCRQMQRAEDLYRCIRHFLHDDGLDTLPHATRENDHLWKLILRTVWQQNDAKEVIRKRDNIWMLVSNHNNISNTIPTSTIEHTLQQTVAKSNASASIPHPQHLTRLIQTIQTLVEVWESDGHLSDGDLYGKSAEMSMKQAHSRGTRAEMTFQQQKHQLLQQQQIVKQKHVQILSPGPYMSKDQQHSMIQMTHDGPQHKAKYNEAITLKPQPNSTSY